MYIQTQHTQPPTPACSRQLNLLSANHAQLHSNTSKVNVYTHSKTEGRSDTGAFHGSSMMYFIGDTILITWLSFHYFLLLSIYFTISRISLLQKELLVTHATTHISQHSSCN